MFAVVSLKAQFYNLPSEYGFSLLTERNLAAKDSSIHTGVKPYIHFFSNKYIHESDSQVVFKYISDDPAVDLIFYNHLINVQSKKENYKLRIDPLIGYDLGRNLVDTVTRNLGTNTRGFVASAYIGNDFYCETIFSENQSFYPDYLISFSQATGVTPGQGRHKPFKIRGYDYAFSTGFFSYQAFKNLNIQVGHGKHKIGRGYRSLLLSDNSFNYPYARITQQWFGGKLQYTNIYAVLMNLVPANKIPVPNAERLYQKKPAAFQYLSYNFTEFLNIGLFQGIIAEVGNSKNKPQLDWMYASPVIFSHAAYYGMNSKNNVLLGADAKLKLTNTINLYGQFMADDISNKDTLGNGMGYQVGINYFNALGVKNLFFQAEYNSTTEKAYKNPLDVQTIQSYSHYNQPLAFTPGTGSELVLIADYKKKNFYGNVKYHYQSVLFNKKELYSNNIINTVVGYMINRAYNLCFNIGYVYRYQNFNTFNVDNHSTHYLYFGIKTNLYNVYTDF